VKLIVFWLFTNYRKVSWLLRYYLCAMYKSIIRPILFKIDAERTHHLIVNILRYSTKVPGVASILRSMYTIKHPALQKQLLGLTFENPVGLAAGFDKDAKVIDELACLGFGFIEIGTLTPKGQPGNDKPRLFRVSEDQGIINRMGFNNQGVDVAVDRLRKRRAKVIIGGNIGKNKVTPNEDAEQDYAIAFDVLYPYVDYFVVNVSSPNTPGLRALQEKEPLKNLLTSIIQKSKSKEKYKPVLLKIAPDLTDSQLDDIVEILQETNTDGVIATNTTISRENLKTPMITLNAIGNGGLSGKPLTQRATEVIKYLRTKLGENFPIIGVGGIMTAQDALDKMEAGANLVQVYTGFIYEGPSLVKQINKAILGKK
jgi:dihydroorotate dehydrogenase